MYEILTNDGYDLLKKHLNPNDFYSGILAWHTVAYERIVKKIDRFGFGLAIFGSAKNAIDFCITEMRTEGWSYILMDGIQEYVNNIKK